MFKLNKMKLIIGLLIGATMTTAIACGGTETVEVEKIVEVEVVKEVEVKGDTVEVVKEVEVIKEVEVKGDTITVVATATSVPAAPAAAPDCSQWHSR